MKLNLQPNRPFIITSDLEVNSYFNQMEPNVAVNSLLNGEFVLVEDFYSDGLKVLNKLKMLLKQKNNNISYQDERNFRSVYRKASHNLLLLVENHELIVRKAPKIGWISILYPDIPDFLISFPDIQGLNSSWQWYTKGVRIDVLNFSIHPFYGTYFPTRFDHLVLFDNWLRNYQGKKEYAIDIGIGSGVLSYLLLKHNFNEVTGTDINKNAIIGVSIESKKLGYSKKLSLIHGDLFDNCNKSAELIVFNPPWLVIDEQLDNGIDQAIYYHHNLFPTFFEKAQYFLRENGVIVLLFSNISKVVGMNENHPILNEITTNNRFQKIYFEERNVIESSKKTKRKNWRSKEKVELWVLSHKEI